MGKSTHRADVTTTDVLTGIDHSAAVCALSTRRPRCKVTGRGNCPAGTRVRTVRRCKILPRREHDFTPIQGTLRDWERVRGYLFAWVTWTRVVCRFGGASLDRG